MDPGEIRIQILIHAYEIQKLSDLNMDNWCSNLTTQIRNKLQLNIKKDVF